MEVILSIDIGYIKPAFILSYYKDNQFEKILIFNKFVFKHYIDSLKYLKYFFSLNITTVLIERQYIYSRNIALMTFIQGYFMALNIPVIIVEPIARLKKGVTSRTLKKAFSVNLINTILINQNFRYIFKQKDHDICDAINIALYYIHKKYKKDLDYIKDFDIPIENIYFMIQNPLK
jgi:hypothetical protein